MDTFIQILIYIHATFGGIALLAGYIALSVKKGRFFHRKSGLVFYYSMLISSVTAMFVSVLPGHLSPFLFAIGIFSLYFVLTGNRALRFKYSNPNLTVDRWIAKIMILTGILMILLPLIVSRNVNVILFVFATLGIVFSLRDLKLYKDPKRLKSKWLKMHLGKTIGGYIAAATAFVVVNKLIPSFYGWFLPGIAGGMIIVFWTRKVSRHRRY
ncbi:MAG: DUF2306 domain-containing protein [Crocinitomicaceae bacterium]|nr:DUF2306 domain-containing protein [Crocinitomicaceae bacterium]